MDEAEFKERANFVTVECEGIQPLYVAFYIEAIFYAASRADLAFSREPRSAERASQVAEYVASIHEALGHAAALSRFFFPVRKGPLARARAAKLRQIFAVGNSSPLLDRELRNALEHFDERLDAYLLDDVFGYIFPGPMVDDADLADEAMGHIFRLVDPKAEIFVLLGRKHPFGPMRAEVKRVADLASQMH